MEDDDDAGGMAAGMDVDAAADDPTMDVVGRIIDDKYTHPEPQSGAEMLPARVVGPASTDDTPPPEVPAGALKGHMLTRAMLKYVPRDWRCVRPACMSPGAVNRRVANAASCKTGKALVESLLQDDYTLYEAPDGTRHLVTDAAVPNAAVAAGYLFEPSESMLLNAGWIRDIRTEGVHGAKAKPGALDRYDKEHPDQLPTCLLKKRASSNSSSSSGPAKKTAAPAVRGEPDALPNDMHEPHGLVNMWGLATFREALVANTNLVDALLTSVPKRPVPKAKSAPAIINEDDDDASSPADNEDGVVSSAPSTPKRATSKRAPVKSAPKASEPAPNDDVPMGGMTVRVERWVDVALEILYTNVVAKDRVAKAEALFAKDFPDAFVGFPSARDAGKDVAFKDEYLGLAWYVYKHYLQPAGVPEPSFDTTVSRVAAALGICSTVVATGKSALLDKRIDESTHPLMGRPASRADIDNRLEVYPNWAKRAMPLALLIYRDLLAPMGPEYASGSALTFAPACTE